MFIIYTCPKCGSDLNNIAYRTYPPMYRRECSKCGYFYEEKTTPVIRIPYVEPSSIDNVETFFGKEPCENCSNNPKNGGSGICHCILGTQATY